MDKHTILKKYILGLSQGYSTSLIVNSPAGLGKTETTLEMMKELGYEENQNYKYISNYITPIELFLLLEEVNKLDNPRILIVDDGEEMLKNERAVGILKGALWESNGRRRVNWLSGTYKIKNKEFNFEGRIILLLNKINRKSALISALIDRGFYFEFNLTKQEKLQLLRERAKLPYQNIPFNKREEIVDFISKVGKEENFSLRVLPKIYNLYLLSPNHFRELATKLL